MTQIIGLAGNATSGKDTFCMLTQRRVSCRRYAFADKLKKDIAPLVKQFGIDPFTVQGSAKEQLREVMVSWGMFCRYMTENRYFVDSINNEIESDNVPLAMITDLRFENELEWLLDKGGKVVFIERYVDGEMVPPANHFERDNNIIIKQRATKIIKWDTVGMDALSTLQGHVDNFLREQNLWL